MTRFSPGGYIRKTQNRWRAAFDRAATIRAIAALLILGLVSWGCLSWNGPDSSRAAKKTIILGIDGLDPDLLQKFAEEGHLPHFSQFLNERHFRPLQTTMPPLSPVAWSTFITGLDPGGHEIYDFLHRDAHTLAPELSLSRALPPSRTLEIGSWVLPLSGGGVELLRKGTAFWEILGEHGVPTAIYRMPANFPPVETAGRALSGMGTPDILGTPGTFSLYTTDPPPEADSITGGQIFPVAIQENMVRAELVGPPNALRMTAVEPGQSPSHPTMKVDFAVYLDESFPVAKFVVQDQEFILKEGEWSDWVPITFEAMPLLVSVSAIGRFYLKQVRPEFQLYVSPLQIDPASPAMPISNPESWAADLSERVGYFYTQELPEDTKAFSAGVFDGLEFWNQAQIVYRELRRSLDHALEQHDSGLLFFYFSTVDQGSHMLWQYMDPDHPYYRHDEMLSNGIRQLYIEMDEVLGRVLEAIDDETTLIVMSDHGFSPFYRGFNLNSWLLSRAYVQVKDPARQEEFLLFQNVDWSRTRAYALGLNGIYLNLRGREPNGIVSQSQAQTVLNQIERDLLALRDPENGQQVVTLVVQTQRDLTDPDPAIAPDIIVGYNRGYRSSWKSPLGEFPRELFEDNLDPWSGDHSIDYRLVPGVLISNQVITMESPALYDLTVAVLNEYGIEKLPEMIGRNCLAEPIR